MTQMSEAKAGKITDEMRQVAESEGVDVNLILDGIASGEIVIPFNPLKPDKIALGIGKGLRTKVNANIGTSTDQPELENELKKLTAALGAGVDTIMDLSTGGDVDETRKQILKHCNVPLGTVPIYQAAVDIIHQKKSVVELTSDDLFKAIEKHGKDGVDFITVHCGITAEAVRHLKNQGRLAGVVSRGGSFLVEWMHYNQKENPLYEYYDHLLEIAFEYDMTLSLGDALRPGALADATDRAQIQELLILGELVERARKASVQVMVEGPGHVPLQDVQANIILQKRLCKNAPFYVLGPLVTDISPGYDHITAAIGGALAAWAGADYLCYVTPSEHLRLPDADDVKEGVIALRISAHAADIAKGVKGAMDWDYKISKARREFNWEEVLNLCIDPVKARKLRASSIPKEKEVCTMCGEFCAIKHAKKALEK